MKRGASGPSPRTAWLAFVVAASALVPACAERARLVFGPGNGTDSTGPTVTIGMPGAPDTTIPAGPAFTVLGQVVDPSGIDTVYFLTSGLNAGFPPYLAQGQDTVNFGLPLLTENGAGRDVLLEVFATDRRGFRGDTVLRVIHIR